MCPMDLRRFCRFMALACVTIVLIALTIPYSISADGTET